MSGKNRKRKSKVWNKRDPDVPTGAIYVGRPTKWGNPFRIGSGMAPTREEAIEIYRTHITKGLGVALLEDLEELRGKDLVCWCAPLPCHADVLLELANA
jgi:hypothetical protein